MPRTVADPAPGRCEGEEDDHTVTVMWEADCPDGEAGLCEDPDCDPQTQGEWIAACGSGRCSFLVMATADQHDALWEFATRHEHDPGIGQELDRLPAD